MISVSVRLVGAILSFVLVFMLARTLGDKEAGNYFYCIALIYFVAVIGRFGFDSPIIRLVSKSACGSFKRKAVSFSLLVSLPFIFLISGASLFFSEVNARGSYGGNIFPLAVYVLTSVLIAASFIVGQALGASKKMTESQFLINCLPPFIVISLVLTGFVESSFDALVATFISWGISLLLIVWLWRRVTQGVGLEEFYWRTLMRSALVLWPGTIMSSAVAWIGQILLGFSGRPDAVTAMAVIQKIHNAISLVTVATNSVSAPDISRAYAESRYSDINNIISRNIKLSLLFMLPVVFIIVVFSTEVLSFFGVFGGLSALSLTIVALVSLVSSALAIYGYVLLMTANERYQSLSILVSFIVCVSLSFALIPAYGLIAAAAAFSCGIFVERSLSYYFSSKRLGF